MDPNDEKNSGMHSALSVASVYSLAQRLIGGERALRIFTDDYVKAGALDRVLDLGCGTGSVYPFLDVADYVGLEPSREYVEAARAAIGTGGRIVHDQIGSGTELESVGTGFDVVVMIGVLHHLSDDLVRAAAAVASAAAPNGRFVTIDPARLPRQRRIARSLADRDRGRHVRDPADLEALLVDALGGDTETSVRGDLLRVPYDHVITQTKLAGDGP